MATGFMAFISAFRRPVSDATFAMRRANQISQSGAFGCQHAPAERRQAVVAASRVIQLSGGPLAGFLDQFFLNQPLDGSIQCRRPQMNLSIGSLQDLLHDAVAMLVLLRKS